MEKKYRYVLNVKYCIMSESYVGRAAISLFRFVIVETQQKNYIIDNFVMIEKCPLGCFRERLMKAIFRVCLRLCACYAKWIRLKSERYFQMVFSFRDIDKYWKFYQKLSYT